MSATNMTEQTQDTYIQEIIEDYRICCISRECSLLGRKEVLTGKAKFGIFGDGKEVPQVAMAKAFKKGDFRSGYYRDQTFMFAMGLQTIEDFFAQLYADPENDPFSGGRQMNSHYATPFIDSQGNWLPLKEMHNVSSDISPTAGQMARGLGLACASSFYRKHEALQNTPFSDAGNEVSFVTIGDASTSEGVFWETLNAAAVMQVPLAVCVWDDGYGISVPQKYQTTKESISEALAGFQSSDAGAGMEIYLSRAWDYPSLCQMFEEGVAKIRETHQPALFHVREVTQPQGHSTSGSHERYKTPERLEWEKSHDCIKVMGDWMMQNGIATREDLDKIQEEARQQVKDGAKRALATFFAPINAEKAQLFELLDQLAQVSPNAEFVQAERNKLANAIEPMRRESIRAARLVLQACRFEQSTEKTALENWLSQAIQKGQETYHKHLYSETAGSALKVPEVKPVITPESKQMNGYQILNTFFDNALATNPALLAFGEDVGHIGDVNQGFAGLQEKHGRLRVSDTGIREWTILGQGIGMAMRGLRPIAEIQYLDYLLYALTPMSDDLATLRYRSNGIQKAPLIIRTRGHRLEGIWHTGSPMGMIINSIRGVHVLVPRNMTQAAGFYNTLLQSDDPALVIECLNGYRLKETLPDNFDTFTVPLGVPEVLQSGSDVTLLTYGSCVRVAEEAIEQLNAAGISVELIDIQSLLPFDRFELIRQSLEKTNRLVVLDEDVPGGASAYILQQVLEKQKGYQLLDAEPVTITAAEHRSPYGSEGDYFAKPSAEDVFERVYALMHEAKPQDFPRMYFM